MNIQAFNEGLLKFLQASPTAFHATQTLSLMLKGAGFTQLSEAELWDLLPGKDYFVTRNNSAIIAFRVPSAESKGIGFHMVGAHTDSPCLKLKPNLTRKQESYLQLVAEVYGGALLAPWFDRDLSIAGRIHYLSQSQHLREALIDFAKPIAMIPSLAIHLNRDANKGQAIDQQAHLCPILGQVVSSGSDLTQYLYAQAQNEGVTDVLEILDHELYLYDLQPPAILGLKQEFIVSARLDNLLSCYTGAMALLEAQADRGALLYCSDHEEVGSESAAGAQGNFLESVLKRMMPDPETYHRCIARSAMISTDNAHGVHPNFVDKHDPEHKPQLNQGVVMKINANQRYASNSETQSLFRTLCQNKQIDLQIFVSRNDIGCGSTIGPIAATQLGIRTLDVGVPTLGMHSCREMAGAKDAYSLYRALCGYFG